MTPTPEGQAELTRLEAAFEEAGGRGVELAERIDELRIKRDWPGSVLVKVDVNDLIFMDDEEFWDLASGAAGHLVSDWRAEVEDVEDGGATLILRVHGEIESD